MHTDRGGLLQVLVDVNQRVHEGELVAVQRNPFGDVVREYTAPTGGYVISVHSDPVAPAGTRILHLGEIASPEQVNDWRVWAD